MSCSIPNTRPEVLSETEIIRRCFAPDRQIIGGVTCGNLVVKLSNEVVVKFGSGVRAEEVNNQKELSTLLDCSIVRVPKVYRFFTQLLDGYQPRGFLLMEYIHGSIIHDLNDHQYSRIGTILSYFSTLYGQHPGPLGGGTSHGLLWEENGRPSFKSAEHMERWLNVRLPDVESKLELQHYPLVLCHLDLAPRNILWLSDGSVCFLDWASAGFYPRLFENCLLRIMHPESYAKALEARIKKLTSEEEIQLHLLSRSFFNGMKYAFVRGFKEVDDEWDLLFHPILSGQDSPSE